MLKIEVDPGGKAAGQLSSAAQQLEDARPLFRSIAGMLEAQTEANFAAQGRPSWVPLAASTRAERLKRNKGSTVLRILQDRGILASSVSSSYGEDFAQGGRRRRGEGLRGHPAVRGHYRSGAVPVKTRLRTDAKGELLRQAASKNLAVFAKDSHQRVRESWHTVAGYKVQIPARPYLPFSGPPDGAVLQPEAETSLLDLLQRYVLGAVGR